jgi:hypothetical protein
VLGEVSISFRKGHDLRLLLLRKILDCKFAQSNNLGQFCWGLGGYSKLVLGGLVAAAQRLASVTDPGAILDKPKLIHGMPAIGAETILVRSVGDVHQTPEAVPADEASFAEVVQLIDEHLLEFGADKALSVLLGLYLPEVIRDRGALTGLFSKDRFRPKSDPGLAGVRPAEPVEEGPGNTAGYRCCP